MPALRAECALPEEDAEEDAKVIAPGQGEPGAVAAHPRTSFGFGPGFSLGTGCPRRRARHLACASLFAFRFASAAFIISELFYHRRASVKARRDKGSRATTGGSSPLMQPQERMENGLLLVVEERR